MTKQNEKISTSSLRLSKETTKLRFPLLKSRQSLYLPFGYKWSRRRVVPYSITVTLKEVAQVCERTLLQIDTKGPVPCHQLSGKMRSHLKRAEQSQSSQKKEKISSDLAVRGKEQISSKE